MFFGLGIVLVVFLLKDLGKLLLFIFLVLCILLSLTYSKFNLKLARVFIENFGRQEETKIFPGKGSAAIIIWLIQYLF